MIKVKCAVGLNTSNTCVLLLDTDSKDSCVYLTHAHVVSHRQGLMILLSYEDPGRCNVMFFRLYFSHFFSIMQFSRQMSPYGSISALTSTFHPGKSPGLAFPQSGQDRAKRTPEGTGLCFSSRSLPAPESRGRAAFKASLLSCVLSPSGICTGRVVSCFLLARISLAVLTFPLTCFTAGLGLLLSTVYFCYLSAFKRKLLLQPREHWSSVRIPVS